MEAERKVRPDVEHLCGFLSEYASWLLGCGATCIRIEKNTERISAAFGKVTDMAIMPSHISMTVSDPLTGASFSNTRWMHRCGISFDINTRLSKLSWDIADGKLDYAGAQTAFGEITKTRPAGKWTVLALASLANASFCRLFNGDPVSMFLVFCATAAGYRLKQILVECGADIRFVFFCCAFVSSVICAGAYLFGWGRTPDIALGTSVLYLIPGIPYINSVSDMLDGHYLCSFSRFMDALILTACLSAGLCGGFLIMGQKWL